MNEAKQIIQNIKKGEISPVYFLMGEESFYIDYICKYIEDNMLEEGEKDFNQLILYGKDTSIDSVVQYAREYPVMAQRRLIIVKEAQNLGDFDKLVPYLERPAKTTILVFCYKYGKLDARKKVYKELKKYVLFESNKIRDYQVVEWISKNVKEMGFSINEVCSQMIVDNMGNDLSSIYNQLKKIAIALPKGSEITQEVVEKNVGISKEFNIFELINAIGKKDVDRVFTIAKYMMLNQKTKESLMPQIISPLYNFFEKLFIYHANTGANDDELARMLGVNKFFLKDYKLAGRNYQMKQVSKCIDVIRDVDLKSKGVGSSGAGGEELLKELLIKLVMVN